MDAIEKAKQALKEYRNLEARIDKMAVADALANLEAVAENMADALVDIIYDE